MAPRSTTETFFFFGDSLTLGVNDNAMPGGWVSRLVLLGSQAGWYDMPPATFYNLGVRRHTSTDIAARWQAEVASRQIPGTINHLAFCLGVVDMSPAQMRPVDEVCATVMQMLDQASALGPVLLICPPPVKEPAMSQRIASLCEAYVTACARKGHPCADVHAALAASPEYMDDLEDGLHPGPQGAALMARLLAEDPPNRMIDMGSCQPFVDDEPFDKRVKTLADNELLEIWEETQQLEDLLRTQMQTDLAMAPEYERLIVSELQLRSNRALLHVR